MSQVLCPHCDESETVGGCWGCGTFRDKDGTIVRGYVCFMREIAALRESLVITRRHLREELAAKSDAFKYSICLMEEITKERDRLRADLETAVTALDLRANPQ